MGYRENSAKRKIYSYRHLHQKEEITKTNHLTLQLKNYKKNNNTKPNAREK